MQSRICKVLYIALKTNMIQRELAGKIFPSTFHKCALMDLAYNEPNEETLAAIAEAREGKLQGPLDVSSVDAMYKSMGL